jgi:hypothetical protein
MKKWKYNPVCAEDEESISDMLSEELDIDSDAEINLENERQSTSEETSNTLLESECESDISVVHIDAGPQFNLLPGAEPMDYFRLFFNDELLNNIVIGAIRYARQNFGTSA